MRDGVSNAEASQEGQAGHVAFPECSTCLALHGSLQEGVQYQPNLHSQCETARDPSFMMASIIIHIVLRVGLDPFAPATSAEDFCSLASKASGIVDDGSGPEQRRRFKRM